MNRNIEDREAILSFLDTDGKFYNDTVTILNELYEQELSESELAALDKVISEQLKYSSIMNGSDELTDALMNLKAENYDDLGEFIKDLESKVENMNREIKNSRESIEDSKHDMSLSSSSFVNSLGNLINKERNPAAKVKTGIQFLNTMLNGRF